MSASSQRRWQKRFIAGAGLACLGAGGILVSGCTTPATAELNAASKRDQQVAKRAKSSTAKKAAPMLAAQEPSGKARVSDLDSATSAQIVAQQAPPRSEPSKRPTTQARRQETQLASASIDPQAGAAKRPGVTKADAISVAAKPRTPAVKRPSETRDASEFADATPRNSGSIRQTAGNGQAGTVARKKPSQSKPAESIPVEAIQTESRAALADAPRRPATRPQKPATKAAEADSVASSHERRRADKLMEHAHEKYRNGYPEDSLRLASIAFELEKSGQATYRRGEQRPSDYITWLQSSGAVRKASPPVIRPQGSIAQQGVKAPQAGSPVATVVAETSGQARTGDVIRANAGSDASSNKVETAEATRPNSPAEAGAPNAPRFTAGEQPNVRAGANAGQLEVPAPPTPRSADASLALANSGGPSLDALAVANGSSSANKAEKIVEPAAAVPEAAPVEKPAQKSVTTSSAAFVALDEAPVETDAFPESETSSLAPGRSTQLTIASLVGLVTGIAGMFGLTWWRRQEQRHYAAGK